MSFSVDEQQMRAAIAAAPADPEPFLVYADFLQSRGDPAGELIMVMHQLELRPDDEALWRRRDDLLLRSSRTLLGGLSKHGQYVELVWWRGFVREATLTNREQSPARSRLARLVALLDEAPAALLLDSLTLVAPDLTSAQEAVTALEAHSFSHLRNLTFASSAWPAYDEGYGRSDDELFVEPFDLPPDWPASRTPVSLTLRRLLPRRLPSIIGTADAITINARDDDLLEQALIAIRQQRRDGNQWRLVIVRPTVNAIARLATLRFDLEGLALIDASRDALSEFGSYAGAFAWAPRLGYAIRPRDDDPRIRADLDGLQVTWL